MKRPLKQSGYNLVEIALVLAIVLMISSLLAVKYYQVQRDARNAETARSIGLIKEAIMDYAAANGARSRIIVNANATQNVQWRLPAGRPYLPCPDITGDGLEDRNAIPANPILMVNVAATLFPGEMHGNCSSNKERCRGKHWARRPPTRGVIFIPIGWMMIFPALYWDLMNSAVPTRLFVTPLIGYYCQ